MGLIYQNIDDVIDDMITMMTERQFRQFKTVLSEVLSEFPQYNELARNLTDEWLLKNDTPYAKRVSSPSTAPQSKAPVTES